MLVGNSRKQVLRRRSEFVFLSKNGQRTHINSWLVINFSCQNNQGFRFGLTIPKYVGNAVLRNKLKRWTRELLKKHLFISECSNVDVNFVLKRQEKSFYKQLCYGDFESAVVKAKQKLKKTNHQDYSKKYVVNSSNI